MRGTRWLYFVFVIPCEIMHSRNGGWWPLLEREACLYYEIDSVMYAKRDAREMGNGWRVGDNQI
jgi:hypothetical protein